MAGVLTQLHREPFTNASEVLVNHGANRTVLQVKVVIDKKVNTAAVLKVKRDKLDPLNKLIVYLNGTYTGYIQVLENDTIISPSFSPGEEAGILKNNYEATRLPTPDDDYDAGYSIGSSWTYGNYTYECVDNTNTAAVWVLESSVGDKSIDGGRADSVYTVSQLIIGGNA